MRHACPLEFCDFHERANNLLHTLCPLFYGRAIGYPYSLLNTVCQALSSIHLLHRMLQSQIPLMQGYYGLPSSLAKVMCHLSTERLYSLPYRATKPCLLLLCTLYPATIATLQYPIYSSACSPYSLPLWPCLVSTVCGIYPLLVSLLHPLLFRQLFSSIVACAPSCYLTPYFLPLFSLFSPPPKIVVHVFICAGYHPLAINAPSADLQMLIPFQIHLLCFFQGFLKTLVKCLFPLADRQVLA